MLAALALLLAVPGQGGAPGPALQDADPAPMVEEVESGEVEYEPIEELRARLRPMTREQAELELGRWFELLAATCAEVSEVEIAGLRTEEVGAIEELNERAFLLRTQRASLMERLEAAVELVERKGGDVAEVRAYMESVTDVPPVTGWNAAWATAQAWIASPEGGVALALSVGRAALVLALAWVVALVLARVAAGLMGKSQRFSVLLRTFVVTTVRRAVLFLGLLMALSRLGIDMTPMLAAIGAAGLVIGLALQGTLSNFASGLMIMVYRPFDVGDLISAGGTLGTVEGMTLVTTAVCTLDNQLVTIPNNMLWGDVITNLTAKDTRRVDMVFGIGYGDDVARAREVLLGILTSHEKVLEEPEPMVHVHELGDSSVNFVVRPWVHTDDYWDVFWDVTRAVKARFDAEGISIPFPQRDVHLFPEAPVALQGEAGEREVLQPSPPPPAETPGVRADEER